MPSDYLRESDRDLREQIDEQWEVLRDKGGEAPEVPPIVVCEVIYYSPAMERTA